MPRKKTSQPGQAELASAPVHAATTFLGQARHAVDESNRIMLLSDWRGAGIPTRFFAILVPSEDHLVVCPPAVFEAFVAELRAETADKTQIPQIERDLNERVRRVSLDRFGRLPLPPEFLARAGIEKQGELVGRFSKFEVWSCEKYQALQAERKKAAPELLSKLSNL